MIKKSIISAATALVTAILLTTSVSADGCTNQYGSTQYGSSNCENPTDLTVNKQVKNPITGLYVENLGSTDATFSPGADVLFRLTIKNTSGETFNPVTIHDTLPPHLIFVGGPGTYDKAGQPGGTLTIKLENVIAGETRVLEILTKVADKAQLPAGQTIVCEANAAEVTALNRHDNDTAQLCIQTNVLGVTTLPVAGFNDLLILLPFAGIGLGGLTLLRKK